MRLRCANCRQVLNFGDKQATSRLYGTHGAFSLCGECADREEKAIDNKGTNDVPELLVLYVSATALKKSSKEVL